MLTAIAVRCRIYESDFALVLDQSRVRWITPTTGVRPVRPGTAQAALGSSPTALRPTRHPRTALHVPQDAGTLVECAVDDLVPGRDRGPDGVASTLGRFLDVADIGGVDQELVCAAQLRMRSVSCGQVVATKVDVLRAMLGKDEDFPPAQTSRAFLGQSNTIASECPSPVMKMTLPTRSPTSLSWLKAYPGGEAGQHFVSVTDDEITNVQQCPEGIAMPLSMLISLRGWPAILSVFSTRPSHPYPIG